MYLRLEPKKGVSLQTQIVRALLASIAEGRIPLSSKLLSSRDLAKLLGVGRNTVSLAYEELIARGVLRASKRRGVFVEAELPLGILPSLASAASNPSRTSPSDSKSSICSTRFNLEYGEPLVSASLLTAWRRAVSQAVDRTPTSYPEPAGLYPLRHALATMLATRRGITVLPDELLIVSGAQQGFDLVARALLMPGDKVVLEDPHYDGLRRVLEFAQARLHPCPVDPEGIDISQLPPTAKLACVSPSHQFPTGALLSTDRRHALLEWATGNGAWILEDDYDGDYLYGDALRPALRSLDGGRRVIYLGTLSKSLFPALRLGYMIMPPELHQALIAVKRLTDRGCSSLEQAAVTELIRNGALTRHLRRATRELAKRREALVHTLTRTAGDEITVEGAHAGMHIAVRLNNLPWATFDHLRSLAIIEGFTLQPIRPYFLAAQEPIRILLGFAAISRQAVADAGARLGALIRGIRPERAARKRR